MSSLPRIRGVLLDRDGVLNDPPRSGYVTDEEEFNWIPGARDACKRLVSLGLPIAVITNQSAVGRGLLSEHELSRIHSAMWQDIYSGAEQPWPVFYCPHVPDDRCRCRKPEIDLLVRASKFMRVPLSELVFIGDHRTDFEASLRAGTHFMHVRTGRDLYLPEGYFGLGSFLGLSEAVEYLTGALAYSDS